ncbi:hypothetical protein DFH07DRAFT_754944 [Mycena maculata]|uniref:Uncharacterized protein n=1 Tax=Mycena maculata TaxID=230809 RepID=A0AAD7I3E8_9AGAR|nr:hypothetical protein DFH07DRAFT_754944 [Mycena maculata]
MPYPTPILAELNLLFESRSPQKLRAANLPKSTTVAPHDSSASSSPASSTSTLALEDEEIQSIFTSAKFISEDRPAPPLTPREELNPFAAPFVPTFRARPVVKAPVPWVAKPPVEPRPALPIWFDAFSRGACTSATPLHHQYASAIVTSRLWPIEAMAELAQHFCWRGGEKITEESTGIAPFAFMVYRQFFDLHGEETAQSFIWHLRECVVGAFKACWDPDAPNAITYYNAPSFNYVAAAIAQATFIGQLFKRDLIPGPHTATCIVILLKGLCSYEHLEALRALIANAGSSFWHGPGAPGQGNIAMHKFVATFLDAVAPLSANMSVLGRSLKPTDMRDIVAEVEALVTGWVYDPMRSAFKVDVSRRPAATPLRQ